MTRNVKKIVKDTVVKIKQFSVVNNLGFIRTLIQPKNKKKCHSFTITSTPGVTDCSGDGSIMTTLPLHALSTGLSLYLRPLNGILPRLQSHFLSHNQYLTSISTSQYLQ